MTARLLVILCLLLFAISAHAQEKSDSTTTPPSKNSLKSKKIFYGEPGKAALYSLILPGVGQVYNKRIWKVPLVYALEGSALYLVLDNINLYNKWNTCYVGLVNDETGITECGSVTDISTAFNQRNTARSYRELSFIFLGVAHLLNVVEAFVDRHLINFDTSEDLTFHKPPPYQLSTSMTLFRVRIPLNRSRAKYRKKRS